MFVSHDVIFDEGPAHHTVSVGETETETPLTVASSTPASNTLPPDTTAPTMTTPTTPAPEPTLHRSAHVMS